MDFIIKEEESGTELLFPVTPSAYEDYTTMNVQKVNAYAIGDVNLFGNSGTSTVPITALFPTSKRSYTNGSAYVGNPLGARELLDRWCSGKKLCRLIIGDETTDVNRKCFLSSLRWYKGGKDMSNDLYCDLVLAYYTDLEAIEVNTDTGNNGRSEEPAQPASAKDYIVKSGDTPLGYLQGRVWGRHPLLAAGGIQWGQKCKPDLSRRYAENPGQFRAFRDHLYRQPVDGICTDHKG